MSIADWSNGESHRSNSESHSHRRFSVGTEIDVDSDHPPGSIVIPITATGDAPWHILAYDSGESTREITNPKSQSSHCPWSSKSAATTCSQVAASANLNATARSPIIGIRATMKLPSFARHRRHSRPSIFPSWRGSNYRSSKKSSGLSYSDPPGSPKVSCWGKVMSEREKEIKARKRKELKKAVSCCSRFAVVLSCVGDRAVRRRRNSQLQLAGVHPAHVEEIQQPPEQNIVSNATIEPEQTPAEVVTGHHPVAQEVQRSQEPDGATEGWQEEAGKSTAEAVGLGAMRRYSSGRRAESWCSDLVVEKEGTTADVLS